MMTIFEKLFNIEDTIDYTITGLNKELTCINIYDTFIRHDKGILVVASSIYVANNLYQILQNYTENVLFFPMDDFLTSEAIAISPEFKVERINTLNILSENSKYIVVTNLMGALRYLPKKELWIRSKINLRRGMDIDRDKLVNQLYDIGYEREILVTGTGKIGVRGFVIDVFPTSFENAIRIEFWGNTIDKIKYFDVDTQLTLSEVDEVTIFPYTEFLLNSKDENVIKKQKYLKYYSSEISILSDYLNNGIIYYYDYNTLEKSYSLLVDTILKYDNENRSHIKTEYMHPFDRITGLFNIYYYHFDEENKKIKKHYKYMYESVCRYQGDYTILKKDLLNYINIGKTVLLCVNSENSVKRILKYLEIDDINFTSKNNIIDNKINIVIHDIFEGFIYDKYVIMGENDLFNYKDDIVKYKSKYKIGTKVLGLSNFQIGDYVVHEIFGIGIYYGLFTLSKQGIKKDYIKILYANDDYLYIPVENIDRISKYSGKDGCCVRLNSLTNDSWQKKKLRVKERLESIANDLLEVSAAREATVGYAFSPDDENQAIFDSEFKYEMTSDQLKAISLIKKEMERNKPMDMLLCGDVGYGKTEVAFRAMFKAVNDSKQVVYLCPTTILSSQQYDSAKERFKNFPINIAIVNRFIDRAKQLKIMKDLQEGKIDIVFGTHRLLSNDFKFKDLGLLIIDEEQRFGVTHKEQIKKYKANVDVLTLSATPIPRTLQMSLTGIRSLALIETPPKERFPIQTYVLEESRLIIKDAIYKELSRDGQVFILYNSVERILDKVNEISNLVPEAKIGYAHGQMSKTELENVMNDFIHGKFNVLICTTIIETGIDIPNVNTLIILDASRYGLSQLYQIRGRIGRSNKIGYAYLMYDKNKFLNDIAIKRLDTIKEFTELGSGFKIAMRDLSIRGAGDILGREQSGFIDTIGIDLYMKMLNDVINKLKGQEVKEEQKEYDEVPFINVSTHISDDYVKDNELKIVIHRKINDVDSYDSFLSIKRELEDRFGKLDNNMLLYMYEEWFSKFAKSMEVENVVDKKDLVELVFSKDISTKIKSLELFNILTELNRNFSCKYLFNSYHIILDKKGLDKHYLIYLIALLTSIEKMIAK